ncbi:MAG TPA: phospholipase A2 family protein [Gemmatimonadaceae bacterium]|nr:phospholipase A2 family protein [Gemmatimonadaceae bacterium]
MRLPGFTADVAIAGSYGYGGGVLLAPRASVRPAYRIPSHALASLPRMAASPGVAALPGVAGVPTIQGLPCMYGRWCGPGCSGPGEPVDNLDRCCLAHDRCYETRGYFACSCDNTFLGCVAPIRNVWTYRGRWAITIWTAFASKVAGGLCNPFA